MDDLTYFIHNPPDGYEYRIKATGYYKWFDRNPALQRLKHHLLSRAVPINLVKSFLERGQRPPPGMALTHAVNHLILRDEPWVVEVEHPALLLDDRLEWLNRRFYRRLLERRLASPCCRKIITYTRAAQQSILNNLDCARFKEKLEWIPLAAPAASGATRAPQRDGKVRLLFVGSINYPTVFYSKGGLEALRTFAVLRERYPQLELYFRSALPAAVKGDFRALPGLHLIETPLPREDLEALYASCDIFLYPAHMTPRLAILEAMSYRLPVVTIDAHANAEFVADGVSGFVVKRSEQLTYLWDASIIRGRPILRSSAPFGGDLSRTDGRVIDDLAEKVGLLIEDEALRKRMGAAGREEVERGTHSMAHRNQRLKEVLDDALFPK
ncbi:MAG: glycosyltransferase family 4 protein [Chloroflexi bacterium]|nr:glycosyltransferase family 4 protein [Chloroflexota bacterium]